jgi:hypothetical protein
MSQTRRNQRVAQGNNAIKRGATSGGYTPFLTPLNTRAAKGNTEKPMLINREATTPSFTCCISWRYASGRQIAADAKKIPEDAIPWRPSIPAFGASKIHTSRRKRRTQRLSLKIKEKIGTRKIFENSSINTVRNKKNK